ncbi:MAG: inositol-3-phosphate synthase [Planctomycetes bacterium]|nr:inositol-3-phosphate synthase [Planctomycetota bacterium]
MPSQRIGIWIIGARGGVASTATLGLLAMRKGLSEPTGLVTALPEFARLDLATWDQFVVGGHEIRESTLFDALDRLRTESRVLEPAVIDACRAELTEIDSRIRRGSLTGCGPTIGRLAGEAMRPLAEEPPRDTIRRLQGDLREFQQATKAARVIVVNLASTEPVAVQSSLPESWKELDRLLEESARVPLPASSLYAIAALDLGMPYVNFTPSLGATLPAIQELAEVRGTCHAGQDGKTGETLLKSVLAPMFAARNLEVLSWVSHNIFGNLDGQVLDDPAHKASKIKGKDALLGKILGYAPQSHVSIEFIRSLGDWKTAWDHIHFRGFLGTPMTLQFTWQGCDSLLAAPLVLDLARLVELSSRRGETGVLSHLGSFFKQPIGLEEHKFSQQYCQLLAWAAERAQ